MSIVELTKPPLMNGMVGIDLLKNMIAAIKIGSDYRNIVASFGARIDAGFQNALIVGAQGTGKTTFAKILAFEYRSAGIVPKDSPILFVNAMELAGEYIGQSEERTKKLLSFDGVVIIDEIDSLLDMTKFGPSIFNTLNAHMGNAVFAPIVIAICYESRKDELLRSNKGLEGRFRHVMQMPKYDVDDLTSMFIKKVHCAGLMCGNDVYSSVKNLLTQVKRSKGPLLANAREVQNIFDATIDAHAARLSREGIDFSQSLERQ